MSEAEILAAVLTHVTALPVAMFWRANAGGLPDPATGRIVRGNPAGTADIIGCYRGRAVAIEAKTAGGRMRPSQARWRAAWEAAGGLYIVARSVDEALAGLRAAVPSLEAA